MQIYITSLLFSALTHISCGQFVSFESFVEKYNKNYENKEIYNMKKQVYEKNLHKINQLNQEHPNIVFDMNQEINLLKVLNGENVGTLVNL